jgi:hypothetical protein
MRWFRERGTTGETVPARALVVPYDAQTTGENESNLSPNSRVETRVRLSTPTGQQAVTAPIPNWLRVVLYYAGSNYGPKEDLPAEIHLSVRVEPDSGKIVALDIDAAAAELEPYRAVATKWWKEEEGPLADVRGAIALPGAAVSGIKGLLGAWRDMAVQRPKDPADAEAEAEQTHRTANALKYRLERNPKQLAKVRGSALQAGPMMADNVRGGSSTAAQFEVWLDLQVTSGAISEGEAGAFRQRAGLGAAPPSRAPDG